MAKTKTYTCKKCDWKGKQPNYREVDPDFDVTTPKSKEKPSCPICGAWLK